MTTGRFAVLAAAFALGACGGQPETPEPVATELAYTLPAVNPVTYTSVDTARINIHLAPGQTMEQTMSTNKTVRMRFSPTMGTPGNLTVNATYVDFSGFMESSMLPRQDLPANAISGDFSLSVTPEGEVEVLSAPELPEAVQEMSMGGADNLFADFFLRLPGEMVTPGSTWTDTIRTEDEAEGARTTNEAIVVSTFRGDTMVAGRTLWIIESTRTTHVVVEGQMQGMSMRNEVSGSIAEWSLWDPARRLLHTSRASGSMSGTVSIPGAGMNDIPLDVTNTRYVRLVESGS